MPSTSEEYEYFPLKRLCNSLLWCGQATVLVSHVRFHAVLVSELPCTYRTLEFLGYIVFRGHVTDEVRLRFCSFSTERTKVLILFPVNKPHVACHVKHRFEIHATLSTVCGARGSLPINELSRLQHLIRRVLSTRLKQNKRTP